MNVDSVPKYGANNKMYQQFVPFFVTLRVKVIDTIVDKQKKTSLFFWNVPSAIFSPRPVREQSVVLKHGVERGLHAGPSPGDSQVQLIEDDVMGLVA